MKYSGGGMSDDGCCGVAGQAVELGGSRVNHSRPAVRGQARATGSAAPRSGPQACRSGGEGDEADADPVAPRPRLRARCISAPQA